MARTTPNTPLLTDERTKGLLFSLISTKVQYPQFDFADVLRLWFSNDLSCMAAFLTWLDEHGLEIRKKNV